MNQLALKKVSHESGEIILFKRFKSNRKASLNWVWEQTVIPKHLPTHRVSTQIKKKKPQQDAISAGLLKSKWHFFEREIFFELSWWEDAALFAVTEELGKSAEGVGA